MLVAGALRRPRIRDVLQNKKLRKYLHRMSENILFDV